jgi:hypothetical protein
MKKFCLVVALLGLLVASIAVARPPYRLQAIAQFHLVADKDNTRTVGCTYCHVGPNGGAPWNPFGENVRSNFKGNISQALYDALKANKDSDGDGYADVLEVFAGTWPGDPNSKPLVDPAFLQQSLDKAGGVDLYKPAQ